MAVRVTRSGVGLIIGIIVLAAVIIGGLYIVKQRGDTARRDANMKIAQQRLKDETNNTKVALNQGSQSNQNQSSSSNQQSQSSQSSQSQSNSSGATGQSATQLPQTGPQNVFVSLSEIGIMAFTVASFTMSRKMSIKGAYYASTKSSDS